MTNFDDSFFREVDAKASLVREIDKRGISLSHAGAGRFKCVCPFHGDTDASMFVYYEEDPQNCYCFACKKRCGIYTFVRDYEKKSNPNWSFNDSKKYFAENYGIKCDTEVDLEKVLSNNYENRNKKDKRIGPQLLLLSDKVREELKNSSNPEWLLNEIKNSLRQVDEFSKQNAGDQIIYLSGVMQKILKELKNITPKGDD